jgi:hypothetical protein
VDVTYERIRQQSIKFGAQFARCLKRRQGRLGDTQHLDELFITINGERQYLLRAVDQDGDVIGILVQSRRDAADRTRQTTAVRTPQVGDLGPGSRDGGSQAVHSRDKHRCLLLRSEESMATRIQ